MCNPLIAIKLWKTLTRMTQCVALNLELELARSCHSLSWCLRFCEIGWTYYYSAFRLFGNVRRLRGACLIWLGSVVQFRVTVMCLSDHTFHPIIYVQANCR